MATTEYGNEDVAPVADLALKHGHSLGAPNVEGDSFFSRWHMAADAAHGWQRHMVHKSQETLLSDADYLAAIEAVKVGAVHEPANMRALTVFTEEQMTAKLAADQMVKKSAASRGSYDPHAAAMAQSKQLAESAGKKLGVR